MKTQSLFHWTLLLSAISANEIQYGKKDHQELALQHPTCVDNLKYCPLWARRGECFSNPVYMLTTCKKSCNQCVTPNALLTMARKIVAIEAELKRRTTTITTTTTTTGTTTTKNTPTIETSCQKGVDFLGYDIKGSGAIVSSWQDCGKLCKLTSACLFWTFEQKAKSCWIKSSDGGLRKKNGRISGTKKTCLTASETSCQKGVNFLGYNLKGSGAIVSSWQDCGKLCKLTSGCLFWSFEQKAKSCWIKSSDRGLRKRNGVISGTKKTVNC